MKSVTFKNYYRQIKQCGIKLPRKEKKRVKKRFITYEKSIEIEKWDKIFIPNYKGDALVQIL